MQGVGDFFSRTFAGGGGRLRLDDVGMKGSACLMWIG